MASASKIRLGVVWLCCFTSASIAFAIMCTDGHIPRATVRRRLARRMQPVVNLQTGYLKMEGHICSQNAEQESKHKAMTWVSTFLFGCFTLFKACHAQNTKHRGSRLWHCSRIVCKAETSAGIDGGFNLRKGIDTIPGDLPGLDPAQNLPELPLGMEQGPKKTVVVGAGPAGLCAALALARRGWKDIEVWDRLPAPPDPDDLECWGDPARSYNLGLGGRGQTSLAALGAWKAVSRHCARVAGRFDWANGASEGQVTEAVGRNYPTMVIQRDRLAAVLLQELRSKHAAAVTVEFGVECKGFATEDGVTYLRRYDNGQEMCVEAQLVIAADGVNSTLTASMAAVAPPGSFGVTRIPPNLEREVVYKTLGLAKEKIPGNWRRDLNWSARNGENISKSVTFEALPTREGNLVAVLLFPPSDSRLTSQVNSASDARRVLRELFPQFVDCVADAEFDRFVKSPPSKLPSFAYAGPSLHVDIPGATFIALGDSIHSVKPYFGLGVNSAFEDVITLNDALDHAGPGQLTKAAKRFSDVRGKEAEALVTLSASFDGNFFEFVLPLILDGIFSNLLPQVFGVNAIRMLQSEENSFTEVVARKQRDRILQALLISVALALLLLVASWVIGQFTQS